MKILDRYLLKESLSPFFLGIAGFILVMTVDLLFTFVDLIINKGIPAGAMGQLLIYKLPSILVLTFPVATLFGVAMCLGRLSKDNELAALRTSGISFLRISAPVIILAVFISLSSFIVNEKIVPYSNQRSEKIIRQIIMKQPLPEIKENIFFKDAYNRYFYVKKLDAKHKTLENILIYEITDERLPRVMSAQNARLDNLVLHLNNGVIHKFDDNGHLAYEANFNEMALNLNEDPLTTADYKSSQEMDSKELSTQIKTLGKIGASTNALATDLFMKYSVPLTPFIFALIGLPLSLPGLKSGRTWGLILTIVIMFTFYVFASVFRSLGRGGIMPPLMAAFFPQMLFGFLGIILFIKEGAK
ncbi:MAG: putative permease [Candidatus Saganbacteria bacterium]|uniref:Putative permease n=1 Tax=Candidatus Saganbacteria bacterium TaxID=2575572 RepID=A0A833L1N1_UNCSA|nr:MAG: putative permease [Candidatus Saganbacteria bacterium]